jgi:hypothetical protein
LLLSAAALYVLPVPHVMYLDEVADFYIFFVLGGLAADNGERWLSWVDRFTGACLCALAVALIAASRFPDAVTAALPSRANYIGIAAMLVCGILSMPALHGLVRRPLLAKSAMLLSLGYYTFAIYLLNTPWIGIAKALMLKVISWNGPNFLLYVPILTAAGIFGPILTKQLLLRRVPVLDRITQ